MEHQRRFQTRLETVTTAPCECNLEDSRTPLQTHQQSTLTLEEILILEKRTTGLFRKLRSCSSCFIDSRKLLDVLRRFDHLLSLFEAAQTTYITALTAGPREQNSDHPSGSPCDRNTTSDTQSFVCEKSPILLGKLVLDDAESSIVVQKIIQTTFSSISADLRWMKWLLDEMCHRIPWGQSPISKEEYERVDRTIASMLSRVWASVARMQM